MVAEISLVARAADGTTFPAYHGDAVRGWLYGVLRAGDPEFAQQVHEANIVPLTCSCWQSVPRTDTLAMHVRRSDLLDMRITTMTERALAALDRGLREVGPNIEIGVLGENSRPRVLRAALVDAAMVRSCEYADFDEFEASRLWRLCFLSRTRFSEGSVRVLLPWPRLIIENLGRKWNAFSDDDLHVGRQQLRQAADEAIVVSEYASLRTEPLNAAADERGFLGEAKLQVVHDRLPQRVFRDFTRLMHFAPFAGVGERTLLGWGQVSVSWR